MLIVWTDKIWWKWLFCGLIFNINSSAPWICDDPMTITGTSSTHTQPLSVSVNDSKAGGWIRVMKRVIVHKWATLGHNKPRVAYFKLGNENSAETGNLSKKLLGEPKTYINFRMNLGERYYILNVHLL